MKVINQSEVHIINSLQYQVVDHCNMNCVSCLTMSPLAEPFFADIVDYERDMAQLAELTDHKLSAFAILGGEPLLHPKVGNFVEIARSYFPNTAIRIVTNGLLIKSMNDEFWEQVVAADISFECSMYFTPDVFDYREMFFYMTSKGVNIKKIFANSDSIRHFTNLSLCSDGKSPEENYDLCEFSGCTSLKDRKLYHCPVVQNIHHLKKHFHLPERRFEIAKEDFLDIYRADSKNLYEFLSNSTPFCKYCDTERRIKSSNIPYRKSDKLVGEWTGTVIE